MTSSARTCDGDAARTGNAIASGACLRQVPKRVVLDVGGAFDPAHGGRQHRLLFNACHDAYGFQPIVVSDGDGRPVAAMLRPARRPTGAEAGGTMRRLGRAIRGHRPRVEILLRADSRFCAPEATDFHRAAQVDPILDVAAMPWLWSNRHPSATRPSRNEIRRSLHP